MRLGVTVVSIADMVEEKVVKTCCVVDEDLVDIPSSDVVVKNSIGVVDLVDVVGGDGVSITGIIFGECSRNVL